MDRERMIDHRLTVIASSRMAVRLALMLVACATIGSTCVIVEEGPPGSTPFPEPSENEEVMEEQQEEIIDDTNR